MRLERQTNKTQNKKQQQIGQANCGRLKFQNCLEIKFNVYFEKLFFNFPIFCLFIIWSDKNLIHWIPDTMIRDYRFTFHRIIKMHEGHF